MLIIMISLMIIQNTVRRYQTEKSLDEAINYAMTAAYQVRDSYYFKPDYTYETSGYLDIDTTNKTEEQLIKERAEKADAYATEAAKKMIAEFNKQLLGQINSADVLLCVKIIGIEPDTGLMDIQVEERFKYPNKKEGIIRARRTMVTSITGNEY